MVYACPCPSKPRTGLGDVLGAEGLARKFKELSSEKHQRCFGQIFDLSCKPLEIFTRGSHRSETSVGFLQEPASLKGSPPRENTEGSLTGRNQPSESSKRRSLIFSLMFLQEPSPWRELETSLKFPWPQEHHPESSRTFTKGSTREDEGEEMLS